MYFSFACTAFVMFVYAAVIVERDTAGMKSRLAQFLVKYLLMLSLIYKLEYLDKF
jgi:hypothetical protein